MTSTTGSGGRWLAAGAAILVAGAAGFGLARLTAPAEKPAAAPAAPAAPADTLAVPADHLAAMQIAVEPVGTGALAAEVSAAGTAVPTARGQAVVTAQAPGTVTALSKRLGDPVAAGEVLARVDSREAAAMAADRSAAAARAALARSTLAREQRLYDERVSPRQDLEAAEAALAAAEAEARRANAAAASAHLARDGRSVAVVSPIAGRITEAGAALGAFVQPGAELFHIADPRFIQIEAAVPAADAVRIRAGDRARVATSRGETLAVVRSITPALDPTTRAATVVLAPGEGATAPAPGEAVQVRITPQAAGPGRVVVPDEAVQTVGGRDVVFVRTPKGFRVRPVVVAVRSGGRAEIASGLTAGQAVATRNAFLLKAELNKSTEEEE